MFPLGPVADRDAATDEAIVGLLVEDRGLRSTGEMQRVIGDEIEGRSPYPERAAFIDSDTASAGHEIKRAADEGLPVDPRN